MLIGIDRKEEEFLRVTPNRWQVDSTIVNGKLLGKEVRALKSQLRH